MGPAPSGRSWIWSNFSLMSSNSLPTSSMVGSRITSVTLTLLRTVV